MTDPARPMIEAENLSRAFGQRIAVDGVSLSVDAGEIYGLVGPDGAGKTTTLRLLCGALRPSGGRIRLAGLDLASQTEQARAQIGYLAQRFSLYEDLTAMENLRFFAEVRGVPSSEWRPRSERILEFVGLGPFAERKAGYLSGGMKQKLGLAAALVHRPRILLLDEPTTGVDPVTRQEFWKLTINLVGSEGVAVVISTPYMDEAARCSRVGFLLSGRLALEGKPEDMLRRLEGRLIELQGSPLPLLRKLAQADPGVEAAQMFGDRLHLRVKPDGAKETAARLERDIQDAGGQVTHVGPISPSLEDIFIALTEQSE